MQVIFKPYPETSMARELGEVVAIIGDDLTIEWNGETFVRNVWTDEIREILND